jgi:small-conductance mechanosensitive channel
MTEFLQQLLANYTVPDAIWRPLLSSVILIGVVLSSRAVLSKFIRRSVQSNELRVRWLAQMRNILLLLMLLGLTLIWAQELRTLALSIVAIAVALVVATKELILCVTGSIIKSGARSFAIGDRIQIKDFRGDVIDQNLLTTTLLEVGPGKLTHQRTGRMIVVPNAMFVSEPLINESYTHDYVLHVFIVPFKREDNWRLAKQAFLQTAQSYCADYLEDARSYIQRMSSVRSIDVPSVDPRVTLQVPTAGDIHLIIRFPAPAEKRNFMEQSILAEVFMRYDFSQKPCLQTEADGIDVEQPTEIEAVSAN